MNGQIALTKSRALGDILRGRAIKATSVSSKHELLLLVSDEKKVQERSSFRLNYSASLFVVGDGWHSEVKLQNLTLRFPCIQMLSPDEFLICAARSSGFDENAIVFDSEGNELRRFRLGDAIEDIRCTSEGLLWVSYFDEGWDSKPRFVSVLDGSTPITGGLKSFDARGGFRRHFDAASIDCYALNVTDDATWCIGYPGFVATRIVDEKVTGAFESPLRVSTAFTISGGIVWEGQQHLSPYAYDSSEFAYYLGKNVSTCRFKNQALEIHREGLVFEKVSDPYAVVGVGSVFHVVQGDEWLQYDMEQARGLS